MLNLNQLYTFYTLVKAGSYRRAAERLFLTEAAVYMQVKSLEHQIQYKLIDRVGKELKLTELGEIVFSYCEKIFTIVKELNSAIGNFKDMKSGILRIGVAKTIMDYLMPLIICFFAKRYPHIKIHLEEDSTKNLIEAVTNGLYEIAISAKFPSSRRFLSFSPFTTANLYFVGPVQDKIFMGNSISIKDLERMPLIMTHKESATRQILEKVFEKYGVRPLVILESASMEFIKNFVKTGKGYSFLPDLAIRDELEAQTLRIIRIEELNITYEIGIYYLKERTLSPQAKTFVDYLMGFKGSPICDIVKQLRVQVTFP
ncbi:MAG: LysR family transcriptional regulator [candidate division WOR-3 bacterium]